MTKPNDGGPAFPATLQAGMSLRDWFAGQALAGLSLANLEGCDIWQRVSLYPPSPNEISELCYMIADAMLKAREQND